MAMLACARLGAVHSVVFGGFAANELATRIDDCTPKLVLTASCGVEPGRIVQYKPLLDQAIELAAHKIARCLVFQRPQATATMVKGRDLDWNEAVAAARPHDCVPVKATDPLYILYTSGTTGQPKGVVRDNGGYCVALAWSMQYLYGINPGEVWWCASDVGWVVGHSYIVYGPLIHGATSILYEGKPVGTPDAGAFWRVISEHKAVALFTAPTAFRAIKKEDPEGKLLKQYDLSKFRTLFLAGERGDPPTIEWAQKLLGVPIVDHWWQTETGWAICGNFVGLDPMPIKPGSCSVPSPGWHLEVLDEQGKAMVKPGEVGALAARLPLPPGNFPTLWNADERFRQAYLEEYPGYYKTGDAGFIDQDGYVSVMTQGRRRDQRRRPPPVDRPDRGSAGLARRRCRMRRDRHRRRAQGPGAVRLSGAEGRRQPPNAGHGARSRADGARPHRPRRLLQDRHRRAPPAQDALGQDPARHHAEDRRRPAVEDAGHHRRPGRDRRDHRRAEDGGVCE